jgi:hypothetical protein
MKNVTMLFAALSLLVFAGFRPSKTVSFHAGIYGTCNCDAGGGSKYQLILNEDHTFRFMDETDPRDKVNVTGFWELKGSAVILKDYKSDRLSRKWKVSGNGKCLRSSKGLEFIRICNQGLCN